MSIEEKEVKIIDLNLFSGSADTYRTAIGSYFQTVDVETTEGTTTTTGQEVEFTDFSWSNPLSNPLDDILKNTWSSIQTQIISEDVIIPTVKYAVRHFASVANWKDDTFWRIFWIGGSYGDETYPAIYNETVWDNYWFETAIPYSQTEANTLVEKSSVSNKIQISCEYNHYLPEYQSYAAEQTSELLIPNMYLIEMFNTGLGISATTDPEGLFTVEDSVTERVFDGEIQKFVSLQGLYDTSETESELGNVNELLADKNTVYVADPNASDDTGTSVVEGLSNYALHGYLTQSVPFTTLSASTLEYVENSLQNIFFDQHSIYGGTANPTFINMETNKELFPYYVNINFPARNPSSLHSPDEIFQATYSEDLHYEFDFLVGANQSPATYGYNTFFVEDLSDNNYSSKFLKTLKEVFGDEAPPVTPVTQDYAYSQDYQSSSIDGVVDDRVVNVETVSIRGVDYLEMLTYAYNQYKTLTNNCYFVGEKLIDREIAMDQTGTYRYLNSKNAMRVIEKIVGRLDKANQSWPDMFDTDMSFEDAMNGWRAGGGKYNETVAYRIEKIGGPPSGDSLTQNTLQNFWVFNSINLNDVNLFDSQVKYGEEYTYNVYAYVVSAGIKYKFSDLRLTRQVNHDEDNTVTPYCLEWYNPMTDEAASSLAPYDNNIVPSIAANDSSVESGVLLNSEFPALADVNFNYEPSLRLLEIPLFSKTLKVLDNPPNPLALDPFHLLNASQTLGFEARYETFVPRLFPKVISSEDEKTKQEYLNAKDLIGEDEIVEETISQHRYLEVYRVSEKPSSYADFADNLVTTLDMKIQDSIYTLPSTVFYDTITTNQKYYYIFRTLNENGMIGQLSEIYEAELVNDGGYTYSTFDVLFEEDLEEEIFINPSLTFKKLIQLQPNMSQISFNDENVNYEDTAASQMANMTIGTADDMIWDKTFKIRLTSKKTGKKIDLNVTYKYETESN